MPLLVAVWQNKITVRYNTADQLQISKESRSSNWFLTVPRVAIAPRGVIFNCSLLPASRFLLPTSRFLLLSPPWRVQPGETPLQDCPAPGRRPAYNPAKHHSKIAQRRAGGPRTTRRNTTPRLPSAGPEALSPQSSDVPGRPNKVARVLDFSFAPEKTAYEYGFLSKESHRDCFFPRPPSQHMMRL